MLRPHGIAVQPHEGAKIMAVAGGTGLAAVYQLARDFGNAEIFTGAELQNVITTLMSAKRLLMFI